MHSSRMCTARLLPVSPSKQCPRGVYLVWDGVPGPVGCTWSCWVYLVPGGVPGPRRCTWSGGCTWSQGVYLVWGVPAQVLPLCGQNDRRVKT